MKTILIVDDNERNRYLLRCQLEAHGYRVVAASCGTEALELARAGVPDALITDLLMPGMDGFTLCREWRRDERLRQVPVVVYSATYTSASDRQFAQTLGAAVFLERPAEPELLLAELERALLMPPPPPRPDNQFEFHCEHVRWLAEKLDRKLLQLATSDRRLDEYLRHSAAILDLAPSAIVGIDREQRISRWNQAAESLFGYTEQEILGQCPDLLVPEELREEAARLREEARRSVEPVTWETRRLTRDGGLRDVSLRLAELGPELGWIEVITDLTSRRELGSRLQKAESRLARFLAFSPTVLYHLELRDGQAVPVWVSENLERLTGYRPSDCLQADWWEERVHPDDRERAVASTEELLSAGRMTYEYRFRMENGEYRVIHDDMVLLRGSDGAPQEVVGAWMDVTETRRADEQARHLEARLAASQRMESIGRLAGGVAHDFNNLLTVILTHAGFLKADLREGDPLHADVCQISEAGQRAASLTQQLLAFSRKQALCPRVIDLNETVRSVEPMLRRLIGEDIELTTVLAGESGHVEADPSRMEQVLLNLVINARDAMPDGGKLLIETGRCEALSGHSPGLDGVRPGPHVRLSVTDTGVGMNDDVKSHVFEPFFTTKPAGKGTGLGLATVYGIVTQSRGHLTVESELGHGTAFHVCLPAAEPPVEAEPAEAAVAAERGRGETVLLVEDEDSVRHLSRRVLEREGYRVLEAANGGEALLLVEQTAGAIDLLFTDVVMPGMSGPVLARRLVQLRTGLKVLYTSGYTNDALEHHGLSDGSITLVQKPFKAPGLLSAVRDVLDGKRPGGAG